MHQFANWSVFAAVLDKHAHPLAHTAVYLHPFDEKMSGWVCHRPWSCMDCGISAGPTYTTGTAKMIRPAQTKGPVQHRSCMDCRSCMDHGCVQTMCLYGPWVCTDRGHGSCTDCKGACPK